MWTQSPSFYQEATCNWCLLGEVKSVFANECQWVYQPHPGDAWRPAVVGEPEMNFIFVCVCEFCFVLFYLGFFVLLILNLFYSSTGFRFLFFSVEFLGGRKTMELVRRWAGKTGRWWRSTKHYWNILHGKNK